MLERPEPTFDHGFYLRAFRTLDTARAVGMDIGPIPWTAIDAYARRRGIRGDDFDVFEAVIIALDNDYLEQRAKALKAKDEKPKEKPDAKDGDKAKAPAPEPKKPMTADEQLELAIKAGLFGR